MCIVMFINHCVGFRVWVMMRTNCCIYSVQLGVCGQALSDGVRQTMQ